MNNLTYDLPVNLDDLCKFTFNFNNLIKVINYLHQNNLNLQSDLKDINQRLYAFETLKGDIEDMKIKSINIQKNNETLTREISRVKDDLSKYNNHFLEINKKHEVFSEKIKDLEKEKNAHENNLNHLNEVVEENIKKTNYLENLVNTNGKKSEKIAEKAGLNTKKCEELSDNIKEINSKLEEKQKHIENIDESIKAIINTHEKKDLDINNRILNINNYISDIKTKLDSFPNQNKIITFPENVKDKPSEENKSPNTSSLFNVKLSMETSDLVKALMDELEENKIKLNKIKEDIKLDREKQINQNENFKLNLSQIVEDINNMKNQIDENFENLENNIHSLSDKKESKKERKSIFTSTETKIIEQPKIDMTSILNNYVPMETFKKLNDNVRILTSALNSKISIEEVETRLKKYNLRLEKVEMYSQGQTHGPRPRINLSLVNAAITKESMSEVPSEDRLALEEIDAWAKIIEKKTSKNIQDTINNEINKLNKLIDEKIEEILNNYQKNCKDIEKNYKSIIDIRNILVSQPTKADLTKLKNEQDKISKECHFIKVKIEDIIKNIEGSLDEEDNSNNDNNFPGTTYEKLKFLNNSITTLNNKITFLEGKNKAITKEVKEDIKQNLKIETSKIMTQFKTRLENFTTRFEYELKNKIDQMGLIDFENKLNNKFYFDLRDKLDKNELKKNNNILNRKIDNLESKISKTLVDTIIDLQMEDQPLIIKKNGNGVDVCASCNQPVTKNNISGAGKDFFNGTVSNMNININNKTKGLNRSLNFTQPINMKTTIPNEKNNNKGNYGQNKLPDIIPSIYQK